MHPMSDELAASLFRSTNDLLWVGLLPLALLLIAAAWSDVKRHRIPNVLVASGALLAMVLHTWLPAGQGFASQLPGGLGFLASLEGLGLGLLLLFPCFALGLMGAGDVKLIAMVGAFLGPEQLLGALLCIALSGGVFSLLIAMRKGLTAVVMRNVVSVLGGGVLPVAVVAGNSSARINGNNLMPYAVPIAVGTFAYVLFALYQAGWVL
jgi:prepilin peptidase CpaA